MTVALAHPYHREESMPLLLLLLLIDGITSSSVVFWLGPTRGYQRLTGELGRLRVYTRH